MTQAPSLFDQTLTKLNDHKGLLSAVLASGAGAAALGGYAASKVHPTTPGPNGKEDPSTRRKRILKNALGVGALGAGGAGLLGAGINSLDEAVPNPPKPDFLDGLTDTVFSGGAMRNVAIPGAAAMASHNLPGMSSSKTRASGMSDLLKEINDKAKAGSPGLSAESWGFNTPEMSSSQFGHLAKDEPTFVRSLFNRLTNDFHPDGKTPLGNDSSIKRMFQNAGHAVNPLGEHATVGMERLAGKTGGAAKQIPNLIRKILGKVAPTNAKGILASGVAPGLAWLAGQKYLAPSEGTPNA